jgi:hypothetical protein
VDPKSDWFFATSARCPAAGPTDEDPRAALVPGWMSWALARTSVLRSVGMKGFPGQSSH